MRKKHRKTLDRIFVKPVRPDIAIVIARSVEVDENDVAIPEKL